MDVVEEGRGRTEESFSVAEPDLETFMRYGIMNRRNASGHPKDLRDYPFGYFFAQKSSVAVASLS
jgi:lipopolysaccharide biosynthesis protein